MKLYIAVRRDLPPTVRLVQAMHAATVLASQHQVTADSRASDFINWERLNAVVYGVTDEEHLLDVADCIVGFCSHSHGEEPPYFMFHEPDLQSHTAMAVLSAERPHGMEGLSLL